MKLELKNWHNVGIQLDLKEEVLEEIDIFDQDSGTGQRKMFKLWLRSGANKTYHKLATALIDANEKKAATLLCTQQGKHPSTPFIILHVCNLHIRVRKCTF